MLAPAVRAEAYSCVDPYGPLARRLQDEPCRWPMYQLPSAAGPGSNEPLTFPKYAQPPLDRKRAMPCFGGSPCSLGDRSTLLDTAFIDPDRAWPLRHKPVSPPTVPDHSDYFGLPKPIGTAHRRQPPVNDDWTGGTEDSRRGGQGAAAGDRYAAVPCDRRKALCAHIGGTAPLTPTAMNAALVGASFLVATKTCAPGTSLLLSAGVMPTTGALEGT